MKTIFTLAFAALTVSASAQITLDQSAYTNWRAQNDIAFRVDTTRAFPALNPGANANWDISSALYDMSNVRVYPKGPFTHAAFPDANFYQTLSFNLNANLGYSVRQANARNASGFVAYGQWMPRQAISLTALSGGPNDSLVFSEQTIPYSSLQKIIQFPATMGSTWSSNLNFTTNFNLTVAAFALTNAACQRKTHFTRTDEVVGWGKLTVRDSSGNMVAPVNVLMVKSISAYQDSFFVGGQLAPTMLLTAFGLTQGQITTRNEYFFYRAGEMMPLTQSKYRDNSFAQNKMEYMDVHVGAEPAQHVENFASSTGIVAYPNPVQAQTVQLRIGDRSLSLLSYKLINMNGQVVDKGTLQPHEGEARFQSEALRIPGLYYLQISRACNTLGILPLSVE